MGYLEQAIVANKESAEQAGKIALLYMRKRIGGPKDVGDLARFAFSFACTARYWESDQARRDSIQHTVEHQHRFAFPATDEDRVRWREEDRKYFKRKAWDWFNGHPAAPTEGAEGSK